MTKRISCLALACLLCLNGCALFAPSDGAPNQVINPLDTPDAIPKVEPLSHYGNNPVYSVDGETYHVLKTATGYDKTGIASWYGTKFHGQLTATREPYDMFAMTAASRTLPLPTYVRVTNLDNGRHAIIKVNDRGPFAHDRILDLSYAAAKKLGYADKGTAHVRVTAIDPTHWHPLPAPTHKQAPTPTAVSAPPQKALPRYLQVGQTTQRQTAEALLTKIAPLTHSPLQLTHGQLPYSVRIGPLLTYQQAAQLKTTLQNHGISGPFLIAAN